MNLKAVRRRSVERKKARSSLSERPPPQFYLHCSYAANPPICLDSTASYCLAVMTGCIDLFSDFQEW